MKNLNNITYLEIQNYLRLNNQEVNSELSKEITFNSLSSIINANKDDLIFFVKNHDVNLLKKSVAKACIIEKNNIKYLPKDILPIIVKDPYESFALISNLFKSKKKSNGVISNFSSINKNIKLGKNVQIDEFVKINESCEILSNVIIESNCTIGPNVKIFDNTIIKSNTKLSNCIIGSNSIIKSGAIIGGSGFGFHPVSKIRIQHFGNVLIKDNCNIGSNVTIDRAVFDSTVISENCFIDNLVQIAHNVEIGKNAIIAAQSGIAGSTKIGKNVVIGGQAGISGHLNIGDNVLIAAKSGVTKNIKDNSVIAGFPAIDIKKWKLMNIKLNKII